MNTIKITTEADLNKLLSTLPYGYTVAVPPSFSPPSSLSLSLALSYERKN